MQLVEMEVSGHTTLPPQFGAHARLTKTCKHETKAGYGTEMKGGIAKPPGWLSSRRRPGTHILGLVLSCVILGIGTRAHGYVMLDAKQVVCAGQTAEFTILSGCDEEDEIAPLPTLSVDGTPVSPLTSLDRNVWDWDYIAYRVMYDPGVHVAVATDGCGGEDDCTFIVAAMYGSFIEFFDDPMRDKSHLQHYGGEGIQFLGEVRAMCGTDTLATMNYYFTICADGHVVGGIVDAGDWSIQVCDVIDNSIRGGFSVDASYQMDGCCYSLPGLRVIQHISTNDPIDGTWTWEGYDDCTDDCPYYPTDDDQIADCSCG